MDPSQTTSLATRPLFPLDTRSVYYRTAFTNQGSVNQSPDTILQLSIPMDFYEARSHRFVSSERDTSQSCIQCLPAPDFADARPKSTACSRPVILMETGAMHRRKSIPKQPHAGLSQIAGLLSPRPTKPFETSTTSFASSIPDLLQSWTQNLQTPYSLNQNTSSFATVTESLGTADVTIAAETCISVPLPIVTTNNRHRVSHACDNCRVRKAKCSGERPSCHRCATRGLMCVYTSNATRVRRPSKSRLHHDPSASAWRSQEHSERGALNNVIATQPVYQWSAQTAGPTSWVLLDTAYEPCNLTEAAPLVANAPNDPIFMNESGFGINENFTTELVYRTE